MTPARLTTWLDCPRRFRMAYVDRPPPPKGPPWAHISLGTTVHNALRAWVSGPEHDRTPEAAKNHVDLAWIGDGYRDDVQQDHWRAQARAMATAYVTTLDPRAEPPGVERTVAVLYDGTPLSGRVDRIDERDGELVVVDYKTGRQPPTGDDARGSLALAIYAVAAEHTLKRPCRTVELHHVPTGAVAVHRHTTESLARHLRRANDTATEARAATDYPARPGPQCSWCDFVRVCEEGSATAGRPRESWEGLGS